MPILATPDELANPLDLTEPLGATVIAALRESNPHALHAALAALDGASREVAIASIEEFLAERRAEDEHDIIAQIYHRRLKLALWERLGKLSSDEMAVRAALDAAR